MKKILNFLKLHIQTDFSPVVYIITALLLSVSIYYNYQVDFEDSILDAQNGLTKVFYFFLFYSLPFHAILIIHGLLNRDLEFIRSSRFWVLSTIGFTLLSIDSSALYLTTFTNSLFSSELFSWGFKISNNYLSLLSITLPLLLIGFLIGRKETHLYGLVPKAFDTKPYFIMLLIMVPIIYLASYLPGFLNQYPMYNSGNKLIYPQPEFLYAGVYEIGYGLNFISVELFFRGFLVIGLMSFAGRKVVLAMAASYCFLHFGKPTGEAISSIFGGYLLGVIAYETKSIWGGIIIHIGIAWTMEMVAIIQHSLKLSN